MKKPSMLDKRACRLVAAGCSLHWLRPREKAPIGKDWQNRPTQSLRDLLRGYRTNANIGLRPGKWSKIGKRYIHVLDVDVKRRSAEAEALGALKELLPNYEKMTCVISGSGKGGRHIYFASRKPLTSRMLRRGDGWSIELFGTGKQVAIPPSIHPDSGKPYRWERFTLVSRDSSSAPQASPESRVSDAQVGQWLGSLEEVLDGAESQAEGRPEVEDTSGEALGSIAAARPMGLSQGEIKAVMDALDEAVVEEYGTWLDVGFALHHEFQGSSEGFELWCEYASKSAKFDLGSHKKRWKGFGRRGGRPRTFRSIFELAKNTGRMRSSCVQKLQSVTEFREAVKLIAEHRLEGGDLGAALGVAKDIAARQGLKISIPDLRKDVKTQIAKLREGAAVIQASDPETALARSVIKHVYADGKHLKSISGTPWVYNAGLWKPAEKGELAHAAHRHLDHIKANIRHVEEGSDLQAIINESGRAGRMSEFLSSVEKMMIMESRADEQTKNKLLRLDVSTNGHGESRINALNGVLLIRKGRHIKFREHRPSDYFTHQTPFAWNPEARCPEWKKMLATVFSPFGEDAIATARCLEEILGYYLQSNRTMQLWTLFFGEKGANGKSQIGVVLSGLLGAGGVARVSFADRHHETNKHFWAQFIGKRLALDDDFKKGGKLPDSLLKKLSDGSMQQADPKGKDTFTFWCEASPLIISNHQPKASDLTEGFERRALVFPFEYQFPKKARKAGYGAYLLENEGEGIFRSLVRAWARMYARGREDPSKTCKDAKDKWKGHRNSMAAFLETQIVEKPRASDRAIEFWNEFCNWCHNENVRNDWSKGTFYDEMKRRYQKAIWSKESSAGHIVVRGLALREATNE